MESTKLRDDMLVNTRNLDRIINVSKIEKYDEVEYIKTSYLEPTLESSNIDESGFLMNEFNLTLNSKFIKIEEKKYDFIYKPESFSIDKVLDSVYRHATDVEIDECVSFIVDNSIKFEDGVLKPSPIQKLFRYQSKVDGTLLRSALEKARNLINSKVLKGPGNFILTNPTTSDDICRILNTEIERKIKTSDSLVFNILSGPISLRDIGVKIFGMDILVHHSIPQGIIIVGRVQDDHTAGFRYIHTPICVESYKTVDFEQHYSISLKSKVFKIGKDSESSYISIDFTEKRISLFRHILKNIKSIFY